MRHLPAYPTLGPLRAMISRHSAGGKQSDLASEGALCAEIIVVGDPLIGREADTHSVGKPIRTHPFIANPPWSRDARFPIYASITKRALNQVLRHVMNSHNV